MLRKPLSFTKILTIFLYGCIIPSLWAEGEPTSKTFDRTTQTIKPWFTGALLANSSVVADPGQLVMQPLQFYMQNKSSYVKQLGDLSTHEEINDITSLQLLLGLSDYADFMVNTNYSHNNLDFIKTNYLGNTNVLFGLQMARQDLDKLQPNIRLTYQQTIPTGHYTFNPLANGTASVGGLNGYQSNFGLNFGWLTEPVYGHYLVSTFNFNYLYANAVHLLNPGSAVLNVIGHSKPGDLISTDIAFEFNLTQHWAVSLEAFLSKRLLTHFSGVVTTNTLSRTGDIYIKSINQYSFAPALEYNVNDHFGFIGSVWFTIGGVNNPNFYSPVIGFVYAIDV